MKVNRPYRMKARAAAAEATRQRVLNVVSALLKKHFRSEIRLEDVAAGAEVTVQTVLNLFGNRATLLKEGLDDLLRELRAQRLGANPGDVRGAISVLMDHYEQFGDLVIRNLAERADPQLIKVGRLGHRRWVQRQFAYTLERADAARRRVLTDALVSACDVYTWKLLRRDMGRSRLDVEATILKMVKSIAGET